MAGEIDRLDEGLQAINPQRFAITAGRLLSELASNPLAATELLGNLGRFNNNVGEVMKHLDHMVGLVFTGEEAEHVILGINIGFLSLLRYVEVEGTREMVEGS